MTYLHINVPVKEAEILSNIEVPGIKEPIDEIHITLLFFENLSEPEEIYKAATVFNSVTRTTSPFRVKVRRIGCFSKNPEYNYPIVCYVDSEDLMDLRARLAKACDEANVVYSKKHEYNPHITLARSEEPIEDQNVPEVSWEVQSISFSAGKEGETSLLVNFPLTPMVERVATKFAANS